MIDVQFGKFRIYTADALNIVLAKCGTVNNPKSKNYGEPTKFTIGYFGNLKQALNGYVDAAIADDGYDAKSVEQLKCLLEKIDADIKSVSSK